MKAIYFLIYRNYYDWLFSFVLAYSGDRGSSSIIHFEIEFVFLSLPFSKFQMEKFMELYFLLLFVLFIL